MEKPLNLRDPNDSLPIRAAWLHYAAGMTQAQVAARLGVSTVKAHRLIASANQQGAVRITVTGEIVECLELEERICDVFALDECKVVPDLHEAGLPVKALGVAGSSYIQQEVEKEEPRLIGIGHGRTLAAAVSALPVVPATNTRFVSLMGGLTRNYAANPHDVMHRLTEKTAAEVYVMPVPFFANSAEDREILLAQRGVREVFDLAANADLFLVGIGTARPDAQLVASRMIELEEIAEVQDKGGVGEILGHFFNRDGQPVRTSLSARTLAPDFDVISRRRAVAIAGGAGKEQAILSILRSGLLSGLITEEKTAHALLRTNAE
ncbi:sugar-binding transcriptional regulator [Chelativorans sp. YIM 93263]|uniref:sugar-binding transcriptional regulator n=1 Tax=Chelativorans sp. YIM 93263 TaxID=2906648 RepID=UPI002379296D|nr:sugar-binding transcriptional regulator [Chelativorans sp. YIM 93263]